MRRIQLKYPPDKIFTSVRHSTAAHSHGGLTCTSFRAQLIDTPKGPMTRREAAKAFNLAYGTLIRRLWLKYPPDKLFLPPMKAQQRAAHRYKRKGEGNPYRTWKTAWGTETSWEVAARVRIKPWSFVMRVQDFNWTLEDAANTPGYGIRGTHFIIPPDEYQRRYRELHGND